MKLEKDTPAKMRMTAMISKSVSNDVDEYVKLLSQDARCRVTRSSVIDGMLAMFMREDDDFQRRKGKKKSSRK